MDNIRNHFDTTRLTIMDRISDYSEKYNQEQLEDLVAYQMRSYAIMFQNHNRGNHYKFDKLDIDLITSMMISLIRPR